MRGGIKVVEGRTFTPGLNEIIVGGKITTRVQGLTLGGTEDLQKRDWTVGLFESRAAPSRARSGATTT